MTLGQKIRYHRRKNQLTQEELAERVGMSKIAICCYEQDKREPISCGHEKGVEWISVDERLPERSMSVLAYSKKYNEVNVYYYGGADDWWDNDGWASAKYYEITHWMPLPEPPTMKGGAE